MHDHTLVLESPVMSRQYVCRVCETGKVLPVPHTCYCRCDFGPTGCLADSRMSDPDPLGEMLPEWLEVEGPVDTHQEQLMT